MARTVILAVRPERYARLQAEISGWVFDRTVEGWTVRMLPVTTTSGYQLRADLAAQPAFDHIFFLGELPTIWITLNPDGHGDHLMPARSYLVNSNPSIDNARVPGTDNCSLPSMGAFGRPYAHVGQLNFDGLAGFTEDEITEQYRRWFARRKSITDNGFSAFPITSLLDNHFGLSFGPACVVQFAKYSRSMTTYLPTAPNGDDGQMHLQQKALTFGIFTGGENYGDGQFLWYYGRYNDQINAPCQAAIFHCFGSHMGETYSAGSMVRAGLLDRPAAGFLGCKAVASVYNHAGSFSFSTLLNGGTGGEAATASEATIGFPFDYWNGDPTMRLDTNTLVRLGQNETEDDLSQAQVDGINAQFVSINSQLADVTSRLIALERGNVTTNPPPPPLTGRINIGGPTVADPAGDWAAATGSVGSPLAQRVQAIDMSGCPGVPLAVLQTGWYSGVPVTYTIGGLAAGQRTLRLYFAETISPARTQRVTVNGQDVLDNFDIASAAGGMNKAVFRDIPVVVGADGNLSFTLSVVSGDPNSWISAAAVL